MLPETLDKLLGTSLTLIAAIISLYVVVKFINRRSQPLPLEIMNHVVLVFFLLWFAAYALATNIELDAMKRVFDTSVLPGLSISYGLLAFTFSVFFALLIITHRNLYLSFPIIMILGFSDLYGNLEIITGMQHIIQQHSIAGTDISKPEKIWISYYLANPQLIRIAIYMIVCYVGFSIFLLSRYRYQAIEDEDQRNNDLLKKFDRISKKHRISLEMLGKIVFISALLINEITIWSWRYDRELMFESSGHKECSGYIEWSPSDFYKFESNSNTQSALKDAPKENCK